MIKSNWPIKNLIMSLNLIFMQIHPIIIQIDLEFAFSSFLGIMGYNYALKFPPKLLLNSLAYFLHITSLYFIFILKRKVNFEE
jgi:hypothetical protein